MNLNQIIRLAFAAALMVAPMQAEKCTDYADSAVRYEVYMRTKVVEKCGPMNYPTDFESPSTTLCTKPGCIDELKNAVIIVPDCSNDEISVKNIMRGLVRLCENEEKAGNLVAVGSGALDGSVGSNDTLSEDISTRVCTPEHFAQIEKIKNSTEYRNACGEKGSLCARPGCVAYYRDSYINQLPDCRLKTDAKARVALCEVEAENPTPPSGAVITSLSSLVALVGVAIGGLIMA